MKCRLTRKNLKLELETEQLEHRNQLNKINDANKFYKDKCMNNLKDSILNHKNNSIV